MNKKKITDLFDLLISSSGLSTHRQKILGIRRVFFQGLDSGLLDQNQKFDLSFSFKKTPSRSLRFSYNNFGEKARFDEKILQVFGMFQGVYDRAAARAILKLMKGTDAKHQTTFGLDWPRKNRLPRLKIYFEELRPLYSARERKNILKCICGILGFDFKRISPATDDDLAAVAIDFLPGSIKNIKTYAYHREFAKLKKTAGRARASLFKNQLSIFQKCLSREKKGFYYLTRRFDENARPSSIKVYKIYETKQINDFKDAFIEVGDLWAGLGIKNGFGQLTHFLRACAAQQLYVYPVIASMDLSPHGDPRVDLYITFKNTYAAQEPRNEN